MDYPTAPPTATNKLGLEEDIKISISRCGDQ